MIDESLHYYVGDNPPKARLIYGVDVREGLGLLEDRSVHTVCTSPPYFGLRDYGTGNRQIGLEATLDEYVQSLVEVFSEIKRVLRTDGTLWLNLGDSYSRGGRRSRQLQPERLMKERATQGLHREIDLGSVEEDRFGNGIKKKDLLGIPWRVAFALQADGWYLRSAAPWIKGNCMPERVTDRPTTATEYIFLFAHPDSGGKYFYDADLVRNSSGRYRRNTDHWKEMLEVSARELLNAQGSYGLVHNAEGDPLAFKVNPKPYKGSHFAVWPHKLVEPMIKASCPKGGVVLDPFSGSATTGNVALTLGMDYIGIDLNDEYFNLARSRLNDQTSWSEETAPSVSTLDLFGVEND